MLKRPEILAPAGDETTIFAALRAGADAVYFGLDCGFNARARADNVPVERLSDVLGVVHEYGKRGYLTLNTLVFDSELDRLEELLGRIAGAGVDAVIVQDLGLARWVKRYCPQLRLHASTQMTCTDRAAIELAASLGANRVTLPRELSLAEIAGLVRSCSIELEMFVHGALCISYSGQCLTSEAIGGRSANRGACAQACRLPYELFVDGIRRELGDKIYLLSPRDLDASERIGDVIAAGVSAVKIEGRLKSADYVAATTLLYRRAIDAALELNEARLSQEREASHQAFSRGTSYGFLDGVDHQELVEGSTCDHLGVAAGRCVGIARRGSKVWLCVECQCELRRGDGLLLLGPAGCEEFGGRVWALSLDGQEVEQALPGQQALVWLGPDRQVTAELSERRVFRTSAPRVLEQVQASLASRELRMPLRARLMGTIGESARLTFATQDGRSVEVPVEGQVELARSRPIDHAVALEKLARLGDTPYQLTELTLALDPGSTLSLSALNRARRAAVEGLERAAQRRYPCLESGRWSESVIWPKLSPPPPGLFVTCRNLEQATAALEAEATGVYLDFLALQGLGPGMRQLRERFPLSQLGIALPRIRRSGDEKIDRYVRGLEPDALVVRSLGSLRDSEGTVESSTRPALLVADYSLNVANTLAALEILRRQMAVFTPSHDLDQVQLLALLESPLAPFAEVPVHHPMPLFHTEHCVVAARLSSGKDHRDCGRPCERHQVSLRDRTGLLMPLEADVTCRNTLFHSKAQSGMELVARLQRQGVVRYRIELLRETAEQTRVLVEGYRQLIAGTCAPVQLRPRLEAVGVAVVKGSLRMVG